MTGKPTAKAALAATLVPLVPSDAEAVAVLQAQCFDEAWSGASVAGLLALFGAFGAWAAIEDGHGRTPRGFVLARTVGDEAEILSLAVLPGHRRRGLGRSLLARAQAIATERGAKTMFLEVAAGNDPARALYTGAGFVRVGARKGYYDTTSGREDAVLYARALGPD